MSELIDCINNLSAKDIIKSVAKTANGVPFYLQTLGLGGFVAEFQAVYDSWTTKPSNAVAAAMNTMVSGWVDDGIWTKFKWLSVFAVHTNGAGEALVNWPFPGVNNPTLGIGLPVFTAFEGFQNAASPNKYIDTNYNPSTEGLSTTSCSMGLYSRTDAAGVWFDMGSRTVGPTQRTLIQTRDAGSNAYTRLCNGNGFNTIAVVNSLGMFSGSRTGNNLTVHQNLVHGIPANVAPTSFHNGNIYIGALNQSGTSQSPTVRQYSIGWIADYFSNAELDLVFSGFETYMDSNGKGVV